jgi:hypothetical protein
MWFLLYSTREFPFGQCFQKCNLFNMKLLMVHENKTLNPKEHQIVGQGETRCWWSQHLLSLLHFGAGEGLTPLHLKIFSCLTPLPNPSTQDRSHQNFIISFQNHVLSTDCGPDTIWSAFKTGGWTCFWPMILLVRPILWTSSLRLFLHNEFSFSYPLKGQKRIRLMVKLPCLIMKFLKRGPVFPFQSPNVHPT